jgi:hypothetical protein
VHCSGPLPHRPEPARLPPSGRLWAVLRVLFRAVRLRTCATYRRRAWYAKKVSKSTSATKTGIAAHNYQAMGDRARWLRKSLGLEVVSVPIPSAVLSGYILRATHLKLANSIDYGFMSQSCRRPGRNAGRLNEVECDQWSTAEHCRDNRYTAKSDFSGKMVNKVSSRSLVIVAREVDRAGSGARRSRPSCVGDCDVCDDGQSGKPTDRRRKWRRRP